jgi:hypothetical protein
MITLPISGVEPAQLHVGLRRGPLDDAQRPHDRKRLGFPADPEIAERALCLRAPILVRCHLDRAKAVGFGSVAGHSGYPVYVVIYLTGRFPT